MSKHRWLRVLTRATTAGYGGQPDAVTRLRDELGVRYAVEGTVRLDGDRLRVTVTVSLTCADEGTCRWAERFDRQIEDVFDVLDEITDVIVATRRALASDDQSAVFHMLRGRVQLARRDYRAALTDNERAIDLNPTFAAAFCGLGDSLCYEGRYEEAITQFKRSVELGTHDPQRWAFLSYGALALLFAGRYDESARWAERASAIPNCQYWALAHRVVALAHLDSPAQCAQAASALLEQCPQFSVAYARRKLFYLKRPEQLDLYAQGLTIAGIPET